MDNNSDHSPTISISTQSPIEDTFFDDLLVVTIWTIILIYAFITNTLTLLGILKSQKMRRATSYWIVASLAICDWFMIIISLAHIIPATFLHESYVEVNSMQTIGSMFLYNVFWYSGVIQLAAMAVNRFVSIVFPLHYKRLFAPRNTLIILITLYLLGLLASIPALLDCCYTVYDHRIYVTYYIPEDSQYMWLDIMLNTLSVTTMIICYAAILVKVRRSSVRRRRYQLAAKCGTASGAVLLMAAAAMASSRTTATTTTPLLDGEEEKRRLRVDWGVVKKRMSTASIFQLRKPSSMVVLAHDCTSQSLINDQKSINPDAKSLVKEQRSISPDQKRKSQIIQQKSSSIIDADRQNVITDHKITCPDQKNYIIDHTSTYPDQQNPIIDHKYIYTDQKNSIIEHTSVYPDQQKSITDHKSISPDQNSIIDHKSTYPDQLKAIPDHKIIYPDKKNSIIDHSAIYADLQNSITDQRSMSPDQKISIIDHTSAYSDQHKGTTDHKIICPDQKMPIIEHTSIYPDQQKSITDDKPISPDQQNLTIDHKSIILEHNGVIINISPDQDHRNLCTDDISISPDQKNSASFDQKNYNIDRSSINHDQPNLNADHKSINPDHNGVIINVISDQDHNDLNVYQKSIIADQKNFTIDHQSDHRSPNLIITPECNTPKSITADHKSRSFMESKIDHPTLSDRRRSLTSPNLLAPTHDTMVKISNNNKSMATTTLTCDQTQSSAKNIMNTLQNSALVALQRQPDQTQQATRREIRLFVQFFVVSLVFLSTWVTWQWLPRIPDASKWVYFATTTFFFINNAVNPTVYLIFNSGLRNEIKDILICNLTERFKRTTGKNGAIKLDNMSTTGGGKGGLPGRGTRNSSSSD